MNYKTTSILGYQIFSDSLDKIDILKKEQLIINTINPHSYVVGKKDAIFQAALQNANILLPDGIGIVYASKWLNKIKIDRIAGYDLLIQMLLKLNNINGKCFFMGTNDETLLKIKNKIKTEFPKIKVGCYAPPFTDSFTKDENQQIIKKINAFNPVILFVGLTAPKQEKWVQSNKSTINAKVYCCIGAAFDFYSGAKKRPSNFWIDLRLEWFVRFLYSPIRFWKRNIISMPIFLKDVIKAKINS